MPTYEFICKDCNKRFSLFTTISGRDQACCPKCQGKSLQQVYKGVRFAKGGTYADVGPNSTPSVGGGCSGSCGGCSGCN
jgi:putative FmdB family regulatory protein